MFQCFGHVICLPAKEADMPDSNAVGINEMFRRLRSAKLSHVADRVPKGFRAPGLRTKINRAPEKFIKGYRLRPFFNFFILKSKTKSYMEGVDRPNTTHKLVIV